MLACVRAGKPAKGHKTYPYLLRGLHVDRPNQVWCVDITYLPMRRGFLYLVAIMDWHTRMVLSWRISNTLDADFCVEALNEAIYRFGPPDIMNSPSRDHAAHNPAGQWIRDLSSHLSPGQTACAGRASASRWTARVVTQIIFLSSACGGP
jgi:putative transposase